MTAVSPASASLPPRAEEPAAPLPRTGETESPTERPLRGDRTWRARIAPFERPSYAIALWQTLSTFVPAVLLVVAMFATCREHYGITLLLLLPASGFFVRGFVLQHDCGHGSFTPSARLNHVLGTILGTLTLTPYFAWRLNHATHHAWSGNLDKRVPGAEFFTMTVAEYAALPPRRRFLYRLYRSPWLVLILGGPIAFLLDNRRFAPVSGQSRVRDRLSVWGMNALLALVVWRVGIRDFALVYVPLALVAGNAGVLLFYVQHQYEEAYFERKGRWNHVDSALLGSSFFDLPRVLAYFTADIGYHHIHHLSTRVPNYRLRACHRALGGAVAPKVVRLRDVPRLVHLGLWDEERKRLVAFDDAQLQDPA